MGSKRILVTGGAGFIGANLVRTLLGRERFEVTVLDNLSTGHASNLDGLEVDVVEGDILDCDLLGRIMPGHDVVVHLAALGSVPRSVADPMATHAANATGTLNVLEAARLAGVQQFIFSSSSSAYGDNPAPQKHESLPSAPKSPYGASKLAAEAYVLGHQRTYGMGAVAFRFFNVYGPLQTAGHAYAAVIPSFVDNALAHKPLLVHGDGLQSRDFTYVETVCATILEAIDRSVTHDGPVNLAFGSEVALYDVIGMIGRTIGEPLVVEHSDPRPGDIKHSKSDPTLLRSLFPGIVPVPIETGIDETVEWFRTAGRAAPGETLGRTNVTIGS